MRTCFKHGKYYIVLIPLGNAQHYIREQIEYNENYDAELILPVTLPSIFCNRLRCIKLTKLLSTNCTAILLMMHCNYRDNICENFFRHKMF